MKRKNSTALYIGCSGWNYGHWKGPFYSRKSTSRTFFKEYASVFTTVEINNTFYQLPGSSVFTAWRRQAPEGFIYSVKANRFITHMKKLKGASGAVKRFLSRARRLKEHLGPVLFQLPPRWGADAGRLDNFTDILPAGIKYVFEFRDAGWYSDKIYGIISRKGMSMCLHDMAGSASPVIQVGPILYVRFHGPGTAYSGSYPGKTLCKWAGTIKNAIRKGKEVYAYFNNDAGANAPRDALRLIKMI